MKKCEKNFYDKNGEWFYSVMQKFITPAREKQKMQYKQ